MNKLSGIPTLNAGAPDLRLSGDQTQRGTYTQRRRNQMAYGGIAGLDGRMKYGLGSWFQEKIKDPIKEKIVDPVIDLVKDNPAMTALLGGAALNQWGLPSIPGLDTKGMGQNWLGNVLGGIMPGDTQFNTVLGDNLPFRYQDITSNPLPGGLDQLAKDVMAQQGGRSTALQKIAGILPDYTTLPGQTGGTLKQFTDYAKQAAQNAAQNTIRKIVSPDSPDVTPDASGRYPIRWKEPLAIGSAIGAADYLTRSDDKMPPQLSVNIPQSGQEAFDDPNLRFKPKEQYVDTMAMAADGGRIGYAKGGIYEKALTDAWRTYKEQGGTLSLEEFADGWMKAMMKGNAQGGRIGADEGGLMNLGGMEKDYRQEGGFVPIGGQEKADDVPARLSKNEFVFTADAVRSAGGGDIDAGAEVMENMMNHLEAGGEVSEDSQGLEGAQEMFANTQRLQNRII